MTRAALLLAALTLAGCATGPGLKPFHSDGCTLFPDGGLARDSAQWCECCYAHDLVYWRGGTADERRVADQKLRECITARADSPALGTLMEAGVRVGGHPVFPMWYRWGFGWDYGRGYAPLTEPEQALVRTRLGEIPAGDEAKVCPVP
ncbi:MAG TPA: hypothetical protein VM074_06010 [Solimonas sp.]|nr:hypothetical protein [Solimonas sp.]